MNTLTLSSRASSIDTTQLVYQHIGNVGNVSLGYAMFPVVTVIKTGESRVTFPVHVFGIHISERMARNRNNPKRVAALAKARQRLGNWMGNEPSLQDMSLAALRLKAGLSQAELAERLNTSQPNVARMERMPNDPKISTVRAWAEALHVSVTEVLQAIENTYQMAHTNE